MSVSSQQIDEEDKPLDPATEKVRRKMVRLLIVSIGIMVVGLMSVFGAIVYKIGGYGKKEPEAVQSQSLIPVPDGLVYAGLVELPQGAKIQQVSLSGSQLALSVEGPDGKRQIILYDVVRNKIFGTIDIK